MMLIIWRFLDEDNKENSSDEKLAPVIREPKQKRTPLYECQSFFYPCAFRGI
jgi:hypothetical protein